MSTAAAAGTLEVTAFYNNRPEEAGVMLYSQLLSVNDQPTTGSEHVAASLLRELVMGTEAKLRLIPNGGRHGHQKVTFQRAGPIGISFDGRQSQKNCTKHVLIVGKVRPPPLRAP
jgi:hypothetical protein